MESPLLEVQQLGRRHPDGQRWLLDDVSLRVFPGQRTALVGPSGSGKTLLLRAIALLDPWDTGHLLWKGQPVRHDRVPRYRCKVIYLHQRAAMLEPTVEQALASPFALAVHRERRFDRRLAIDLLEQLGRSESFLDKTARDLSGGEIQITALVRAIQLDPCVLLLDEPTAALDAATTEAVERLVNRWVEGAEGRRSLVWVSHDADQSRRTARSVLRMEAGRLIDVS